MVEVNQREQAVPGVDPEGFDAGRDRVKIIPYAKGPVGIQMSLTREEGETLEGWVTRTYRVYAAFKQAFGAEG